MVKLGVQQTPMMIPEPGHASRPDPSVLHAQSGALFPRPRSGYAGVMTLIVLIATVALAWWLIRTEGGSVWIASLMLPIVAGVLGVFLLPRLRRLQDRLGRFHGDGVVVLTDHAGEAHGEDAQQRALIQIENDGSWLLLAATQSRLRLALGDRVSVTWSRRRSDSCYVHAIHEVTAEGARPATPKNAP